MSKKSKKAIVLGGTHDHIRLLTLLSAQGYETLLIDYLPDPPARSVADRFIRESILDREMVEVIAKEEDVDLIIATCIDQALEVAAAVSETLGLPCHIDGQTALELTNKSYMKRLFLEAGVPTSPCCILTAPSDPVPAELCYPLVVKPADCNSSKGITKVTSPDGLTDAVACAHQASRTHTVVVEEFVAGDELSVDLIVHDGRAHMLMVTENRKIVQNQDHFTILESLYRPDLLQQYRQSLEEIGENIAQAFGLNNTPLLIQAMVRDDHVSVIEFSARIGGGSKHHFIRSVTGVDVLQYFVDSVVGTPQPPEPVPDPHFAATCYIYCHPGTYARIEGLETNGIAQSFIYKTPPEEICQSIASSDRPAGFITQANSLEALYDQIDAIDSQIAVRTEDNQDIMLHGLYAQTNRPTHE
jgi:biotin carboxylase